MACKMSRGQASSPWSKADSSGTVLGLASTSRWPVQLAGSRVAIAPDGTWLATASRDDTLRIWDTATGRQLHILTRYNGPQNALAIAPDGAWLTTTSRDGTVSVWDTATGAASAVMRVDSKLQACAWDPAGRLLAAAGDAGLYLFQYRASSPQRNSASSDHLDLPGRA
jgi:WD40 repeat protein